MKVICNCNYADKLTFIKLNYLFNNCSSGFCDLLLSINNNNAIDYI